MMHAPVGRMTQITGPSRSVALGLCLFAVACAVVGATRRAPPPSTLGSYELTIRGAFAGKGSSSVLPTSVALQVTVRDTTGNSWNLSAQNLPLENGRFDGPGSLSGLQVRVVGRVDPPSDVVPVARMSVEIITPSGRTARGFGAKR